MPAATAAAQERMPPTAEFAAGALVFPDDGSVAEGFIGGAARVYLSPRLGIGPEASYVHGEHHSHFIVTGNITFDTNGPVGGAPLPFTGFFVLGGGLFQTRETFVNDQFTSTEGAFTAGGGVRSRFGRRMTAGVEARIGWELHIRLNASIGVLIGK